MKVPASATVDTITSLFAQLEYGALGDIYCNEGGTAFWDDRRGPALELGLIWAAALGRRLPREGSSLYVGGGVAELPALVMEALDLHRSLRIANLRSAECEILNRSLAGAGLADRIRFTAGEVSDLLDEDPGKFDHLSLVSVLDDPETYPLVSGVTYGRIPPVLLDMESFCQERDEVRQLVTTLFDAAKAPFLVTTTAEEVPWFLHEAEARNLLVEADDETVETALVGDPIGFLRVGGRRPLLDDAQLDRVGDGKESA